MVNVTRSHSCSQLLPAHPTMATACLTKQIRAKEDTDIANRGLMAVTLETGRGRSPCFRPQ